MKIAVIGSGISGLIATWRLCNLHDVTLFEKNNVLGGHTATKEIEYNGQRLAIDTGFIVFNDWTYPSFNKFINTLGVEFQDTEMSFSVTNKQSGLEYNGNNLNSLFAQRRNLFKPSFYRFIGEILRFNKLGKRLLSQNSSQLDDTLGHFLKNNGFSDYFATHYILAMGAAIWSSGLPAMKDFPLRFFMRFFENHGLLNVQDRPQWKVIKGGSARYIDALYPLIKNSVKLKSEVSRVIRTASGVQVMVNGQLEHYDKVIFACHSDQVLSLLANPTAEEVSVLSDIPYKKNRVILHTDTTLLPKRKAAWAAWNYYLDDKQPDFATLTYNMNILQRLQSDTTFCVTLNQCELIQQEKIIGEYDYAHPVYSEKSLKAQQKRALINGFKHSYFCGAYWFNGFHEDGVRSALDVSQMLGAEPL
ncbi:NAD(P)/FAD-dependent oxidoreductase [Catenovulum sediminis]|uniref:FAD-dependent oxidoreductase n=1 Tax=Catenovulum sediminis TaxID=1740262 RepID=A0ABV1RL90_9ALTE